MNFNRPKVTRRRRRKGATTHLYDFITLFSFCKVRLRSFFALFLRFLPPFPPPGNDVGGRTQNRDGRRTRQRKISCFFVGFRGKRDRLPFPLCKRARRGRPYSPENARSPFPLCRGDQWSPAFFRVRSSSAHRPHVSPVKQRAKEGDAAAPPSE